ncbi:hypothetical protein [Erysipelothrix piscisicarius]|uniref:hypothetical protein n=1 Tax=Erysipelothrix piscisicarius TaxID=2485784 RepID=UPI002F959356
MVTQTVNLNELDISLQQLVGIENKNINLIEKNYEVNIQARDAHLSIEGAESSVEDTVSFIRLASSVINHYERLDVQNLSICLMLSLIIKPTVLSKCWTKS